MADKSRSSAKDRGGLAHQDVSELARLALARLASPSAVRPVRSARLSGQIDDLCAAFLSVENADRHRIVQGMRRNGVTASEIIDHVLPAVAQELGHRWTEDRLSFVEVTIGTARVQEAVRGLIAEARSCPLSDEGHGTTSGATGKVTPKVLLVVPRAEDHTLGTFVAADQLRRFGYGVDIALDQHPKQIAVTLREHQYCMVGLTIAGRRTLASARELVDIIRSTVTRAVPIVLGGSLAESDGDLKEATGVDHVARTVRDALELCGLSIAKLDPSRGMMTDHSTLTLNDL